MLKAVNVKGGFALKVELEKTRLKPYERLPKPEERRGGFLKQPPPSS